MKVILSVFLLVSCCTSAQTMDTTLFQTYLKANSEVLDTGGTKPIGMFDAGFYKNDLFLFGENHGSSLPLSADPVMFKQLYHRAGVRHYVAEVDDTKAWMLNNYLRDGNEQWLTRVFASWVKDTAQWASQENYKRYALLRAFYQSLPAGKKFVVLGIDVIQDYRLLKEQVLFYQRKRKSAVHLPMLDSLVALTDTITYAYRKQLGAYCRGMLQHMSLHTREYQRGMGGDFATFRHMITSFSFPGSGMYRDSIMYRNFADIVDTYQLSGKKLYGFMGFYHTLQVSYDGRLPFAAYLQQGKTGFSGKTVSIQMFAINSMVMLPLMGQLKQMMPASYIAELRKESPYFPASEKYIPYPLSNDGVMMNVPGIQNLKSVTQPNTTTLLRLNGAGSPYNSSRQLMETTGFQTLKPGNAEAVTTAAFQYVLLFRNSRAALPLIP